MKIQYALPLLALALFSCDRPEKATPSKAWNIVATSPILRITTAHLASDTNRYRVLEAVHAGGHCAHEHHLSAEEMQRLCRADLVIAAGANLDPFVAHAKEQCPQMKVVEVISPCADLPSHEGGKDPHTWLSEKGMQCIVQKTSDALASFDSTNKKSFQEKSAQTQKEIAAKWLNIRAKGAAWQGRKAVSFHGAYAYWAKEFGIQIVHSFGEELEHTQPSAQEIAQLIQTIRDQQVQWLWAGEEELPELTKTVQAETQAKLVLLKSMPNSTDTGFGAYYQMLEENGMRLLK